MRDRSASLKTLAEVRLGDVVLRNRLVTSSSLLGYGMSTSGFYGMSPVALFLPLAAFGAVTTRTLTVQPRDGHFTTREDWAPRELPGLLRRYRRVLRGTDGGWINAFGWCNVGIDAYLADYFPHTRDQRTIISLGGFSAEEFVTLVDRVNAAVPAGEIAAVEFNVSCHNVNFDFSDDPPGRARRGGAPQQPPGDPQALARLRLPAQRPPGRAGRCRRAHRDQHREGACGSTPAPAPPGWPTATEGSPAGRSSRSPCGWWPSCATPGCSCRSSPRAASATVADCREYFWAGADAVSLGSATWLASYPGYALAPLRALRARRVLAAVRGMSPPDRAPQPHRAADQPPEPAPDLPGEHAPSQRGPAAR